MEYVDIHVVIIRNMISAMRSCCNSLVRDRDEGKVVGRGIGMGG